MNTITAYPHPWRPIRSYIKRSRGWSERDLDFYHTIWPRIGLANDVVLNIDAAFHRHAPTLLEIGFGNAECLIKMAQDHPELNFIGIEVYRAGILNALKQIAAFELNNIRLYEADATLILKHCIPAGTLAGIQLFFPDPWPKRKHHKRRIVQPDFVTQVATVLQPHGVMRLATDWLPYAQWMMTCFDASCYFKRESNDAAPQAHTPQRPLITKFEQRGHRAGHPITDLIYWRNSTHTHESCK